MKRYRGAWLFGGFIAFAVFIVVLFNAQAAPVQSHEGGDEHPAGAPVLPDVWGQYKRTAQVRGAQALTEINRLHGKTITMADGLRANYTGPDGQQFIVWVATTGSDAEARELEKAMTDRMGAGTEMFTRPVVQEHHGMQVYRSEGMGQVHFYYARGPAVVWIAIAAKSPDDLAAKLISSI